VGTTWRRHNPPEDQEDAVERVEGRVEAGALSKGPEANHALLLAELVTLYVLSLHSGEVMEKPVSAADANRKFSKLLRAVREGQSFVVTSHGRAVARLVPAEKNSGVTRGAKAALLKRLRSEPVVTVGRWRRDELYEATQ